MTSLSFNQKAVQAFGGTDGNGAVGGELATWQHPTVFVGDDMSEAYFDISVLGLVVG
ncbi:hypothetical protein [Shewanella xiamenensis]|uniref:Uncharacterized protein n=1 Tax=Shewanella xiamenensis TaxID=332186 RepID=A0ABT6U866_9GAMM|nr:hypothetical protein [Shewanella xiamenensis]MDI5830661.1 hypothetical protein [Shewanella xiamenensis]